MYILVNLHYLLHLFYQLKDFTVQKLDIESKNYFNEKKVSYKNREYIFYEIVGFDSNDIKEILIHYICLLYD